MRLTATFGTLLLAAGIGWTAWAQSPDRNQLALQAAMKKETVDGDLKGAIDAYKKLSQGKDQAIAAKALVRMGECYERLGDAEARKIYERVVREFGNQKDSVDAARARLAALGRLSSPSGPTMRPISVSGSLISHSDDGRMLLQSGPDGELDLRDSQTGQVRHLVKSRWYDAAISRDGQRVAFFRWTDSAARGGLPERASVPSSDRLREVRIIGTDGSGERLLWRAEQGQEAWGTDWLPDGKHIIVTVVPGQGLQRFLSVSTTDGSTTTLWDGRELSYSWVDFSPDGKSVVYARSVRQNPRADELRLLRFEDRSDTLLFEAQSFIGYALWTPDGSGVVFQSDRRAPGTVDLWLLRVSGGKPLGFPAMVKTDLGTMVQGTSTAHPSYPITRDGTLYFNREGRGGMTQLLTIQFDPRTGKVAGTPGYVSRTGGISRSPSFSRDGRWLAYLSQQQNLVIQSLETKEERVVPINPAVERPGWVVLFPDGKSALVSATGIYKVDIDSGARTSLNKAGESEVRGWANAISPDGRIMYYNALPINRMTRLLARDLETGQERELARGEGAPPFSLSHDGTQLAHVRPDGKDVAIDVLPSAGGTPREVYRFKGVPWADAFWEPDGRHLVLNAPVLPDGTRGYLRVLAEGGEAQHIGISAAVEGQFPMGFGALRVHPNGRELVYVARDSAVGEQEVFALENFLPGFKSPSPAR